jgi:hypothetical protein
MTVHYMPAFGSNMGLTKREWFAGLAMEGLLADSEDRSEEIKPGETCAEATARLAVEHADALIKELNKNV